VPQACRAGPALLILWPWPEHGRHATATYKELLWPKIRMAFSLQAADSCLTLNAANSSFRTLLEPCARVTDHAHKINVPHEIGLYAACSLPELLHSCVGIPQPAHTSTPRRGFALFLIHRETRIRHFKLFHSSTPAAESLRTKWLLRCSRCREASASGRGRLVASQHMQAHAMLSGCGQHQWAWAPGLFLWWPRGVSL
jgi:hypothetical protein